MSQPIALNFEGGFDSVVLQTAPDKDSQDFVQQVCSKVDVLKSILGLSQINVNTISTTLLFNDNSYVIYLTLN